MWAEAWDWVQVAEPFHTATQPFMVVAGQDLLAKSQRTLTRTTRLGHLAISWLRIHPPSVSKSNQKPPKQLVDQLDQENGWLTPGRFFMRYRQTSFEYFSSFSRFYRTARTCHTI